MSYNKLLRFQHQQDMRNNSDGRATDEEQKEPKTEQSVGPEIPEIKVKATITRSPLFQEEMRIQMSSIPNQSIRRARKSKSQWPARL